MNSSPTLEMIPISSLNALEYCPRSFYYQVVQGEAPDGEALLEGQLAHRRVHQPGTRVTEEGVIETTRLYLASERLHLTGFADVIEERAGQLIPIEYKQGRHGPSLGEQIQLCAQALCLEERQPDRSPIPYGYISSTTTQSRTRVPLTEQLRTRTRDAITRALQVAARATPPPPLSGELTARCPPCGLFPLCLPDEVRLLQAREDSLNEGGV